jgi:hypothetical protein
VRLNFSILLWERRSRKGEKATEVLVLQPTKFYLIIDLKTAKTFDLTFPLTLLGREGDRINFRDAVVRDGKRRCWVTNDRGSAAYVDAPRATVVRAAEVVRGRPGWRPRLAEMVRLIRPAAVILA